MNFISVNLSDFDINKVDVQFPKDHTEKEKKSGSTPRKMKFFNIKYKINETQSKPFILIADNIRFRLNQIYNDDSVSLTEQVKKASKLTIFYNGDYETNENIKKLVNITKQLDNMMNNKTAQGKEFLTKLNGTDKKNSRSKYYPLFKPQVIHNEENDIEDPDGRGKIQFKLDVQIVKPNEGTGAQNDVQIQTTFYERRPVTDPTRCNKCADPNSGLIYSNPISYQQCSEILPYIHVGLLAIRFKYIWSSESLLMGQNYGYGLTCSISQVAIKDTINEQKDKIGVVYDPYVPCWNDSENKLIETAPTQQTTRTSTLDNDENLGNLDSSDDEETHEEIKKSPVIVPVRSVIKKRN